MASSSRLPAEPPFPDELHFPDHDDEPRVSQSSSRRRAYYSDQRGSRSTRPSTGDSKAPSSKSRGKRASYQEPASYANLDEPAVPPPVDADAWKSQHPPSVLEERMRQSRSTSHGQSRSGQRNDVRRRRSGNRDEQGLTEAAAPPPIPSSRGTQAGSGAQQSLEDGREQQGGPDEYGVPYRQRRTDDLTASSREAEVPKFLTELYTISYLIFFAILGTLARLGVQWITFYPGTPVVMPVIWANFGGSLIMGFLSEDQRLFREAGTEGGSYELNSSSNSGGKDLEDIRKAEATKRKKAIPLYIGLATGFCGSFTSFSSFARDVFLALSNNLPTPINHRHRGSSAPPVTSTISRNGGYSFEACLHVVIATLALSLGGLIAGAQLAVFVTRITPRIHGNFVRKIVDPLMVLLGFGCWLGAVLLAIFPPADAWRGQVVFALVFAPLGCLLRFYASKHLNGLVPSFPLGTFAVNMLGTAILGMGYDIQRVGVGVMGRVGGGVLGCQILQGIEDGFCGCLTTVSTWVSEINGLKRKHGWLYALGSILGGFCLMVAIMGSVRWSVGFSEAVCDTGYTSKQHG